MLATGKSSMQVMRARYDEARTEPGAIFFQLWRRTDNTAINHFHGRSSSRKMRESLSCRTRAHSVQIEKVQWCLSLLEPVVVYSGDDTRSNGLGVPLRGDGEYIVRFVA